MYSLVPVPELQWAWKLVVVVVVAGVGLGWEVGASRASRVYAASPPSIKTELVSMPHTSTVAVVTVPAAPPSREVARLRTRTRRLEATLEVMRQREFANNRPAEDKR